jgi:hypothetical protein
VNSFFRLLPARAQAALPAAPFHEWLLPEGAAWTQFVRTGRGYLLRFPGLADFELSGEALDTACVPAPGTDAPTCEHLYRNQVLPLALSMQGKLVIHASAVEAGGGAVAFVAKSGTGKSTLAASFATCGHPFLSDDGLVVQAAAERHLALPSHPSLRLWDDSRRTLVGPRAATGPGLPFTAKQQILADDALAFCGAARILKRVFFLGPGIAETVTFQRMAPAEATMEWIRHSFLLDPHKVSLLAAQFDRVAALTARTPCYRLDYPRQFDRLVEVREAIERQLCQERVTA